MQGLSYSSKNATLSAKIFKMIHLTQTSPTPDCVDALVAASGAQNLSVASVLVLGPRSRYNELISCLNFRSAVFLFASYIHYTNTFKTTIQM